MSISSISTTDNITSMVVVSCGGRLPHLHYLCWYWWHVCTRHTWPACLVTINILITSSCEQKYFFYLSTCMASGCEYCEYFGLSGYMFHSKVVSHSDTVTAQPLPYLGLEMMRGIFHLNFTFEILSRHCQVGGHAATPTVRLQATLQKRENH